MRRTLQLTAAITALLALLLGAGPVAAATGDGAAYGACVAYHATSEGGFTADHNPGMHQGAAGWPGCPNG
jgi:hypothetical protein